MVSLARYIYNDSDAGGKNPMELLDDSTRFPDSHAIEDHLLKQLVPAVYASNGRSKPYNAEDAQRWLSFLALTLVDQDTLSFAWWRPGELFDAPIGMIISLVLATGGFCGLAFLAVIIWSFFGWHESLGNPIAYMIVSVGLALFLGAMFSIGSEAEPKALKWRWEVQADGWVSSFREQVKLIFFHPKHAAVNYICTWLLVFVSLLLSIIGSLYFLAGFLFFAVPFLSAPPASTESSTPKLLLDSDWMAVITCGGLFGTGMSAFAAVHWLVYDDPQILRLIPWYFLPLGLLMIQSASTAWLIRCVGLARNKLVPRRFIRFLDDAHKRDVLRVSGGVYQFRHALLQYRLARLWLEDNQRADLRWLARYKPWPAKLAVLQFKAKRFDAATTIDRLCEIIETYRREGEYDRAAESWHLLIDVRRSNDDIEGALREVQLLRESGLPLKGKADWQTQRILIELYRDKNDLLRAKAEMSRLDDQLSRAKIRPSRDIGPFAVDRFRSDLRKNPIFIEEEGGGIY
jgi:hypothetical protein